MAAETYYFYVGYFAQPAPNEYQHIFEKKLVRVKYTGDNDYVNKLKEDYVAFVKKNHPEYYKAFVINSDAAGTEFKIRAMAKVQGPFASEKDALGGRKSEMKDQLERFAKDPKNGPVIEVDEYRYKQ